MTDELTSKVSKTIEDNGPIKLEGLCKALKFWPRSGISRRLQFLRKSGSIVYINEKGWDFNEA